MKNIAYKIEKYGNVSVFTKGQKVMCCYYHEYEPNYEDDAYKRTFLERLIDAPFKPVKFGVIVGSAGVHPFWLGDNRREQYLLVKFKEYHFAKPIPISCIQDAATYVKEHKDRIAENDLKPWQDKTAYDALNRLADEAEKFLQDTPTHERPR
jgi:hypothetical protein